MNTPNYKSTVVSGELTTQEIMDEYFETNHYQNPDGTELGEEPGINEEQSNSVD